jgi:hypothetical protein
MKYNSIREYFYKLHNVLYALVLIPLLVFIYVYLEFQYREFESLYKDDDFLIRIVVFGLSIVQFVIWIFTFYTFNKKLKQLRLVESLGERLDQYYKLTTVRFTLVTVGSLMLAAGFYLTEDQVITVLFVTSLGILSLLWPLPSKVCRDLKLRGDERTMVLFRKDTL